MTIDDDCNCVDWMFIAASVSELHSCVDVWTGHVVLLMLLMLLVIS